LPEDFEEYDEKIEVGFQSKFIQKIVKIGEVSSLDMNVYQITHHSENDPRISLSRDSFRLLAQYGIKRALILFISKSSLNYRLSLVTIDLKWEEGKRVKKEYSNPHRYSFFLGPETKTHTPETYLIKKGRVKDFEDLKNRFSIEVVNKDFYTQIAILFTKLAGGERTIGRTKYEEKGSLQLPSTSDDTIKKEFSVRLIGRLIFCWFLKKKTSNKGISLIPEELLSSKSVTQKPGFYHNILEPLFFETLNTPTKQRKKEYQITPWSQIPFLNGGLFMPEYHDYYQVDQLGISKYINTLKVPDDWLKELFEIFEIYNFTIDENTPVDVELSIEPEMLGRIFENLLAEINPETGNSARKSTGSYYTPRPIVEYMVDESLKQYLLTKTNIDENKIFSLLDYGEEETNLNEFEKDTVIDALDVIKIIDPACGSGAFPMGILQKMLLILQKIDPESKKWLTKKVSKIENAIVRKEFQKKVEAENWNYVHKLGIIQSSIYGIDIQPIAVDISKLRFFLSLIVDENVDDSKENRGVDWLPNLEFKFVCANSLIGLPATLVGSYKERLQPQLFETVDSITELKKLREEYLKCYGDEKTSIEKKFQDIQSRMFLRSLKWGGKDSQTAKLSQWNPFSSESCEWFDPEWMFGVSDGFDIIITNPPYIGEKGHKEIFREIKQGTLGRYYHRKMDLFYFFFHLALNIGNQNSSIAFITTNYYPTATGAKKLRQDFKERTIIKNLMNFNELKIFESALGQHNMVTILQKRQDKNAIAQTCITKRQGFGMPEVLQKILSWDDVETNYYKIYQNDLYDGNEFYIRTAHDSGASGNTVQTILSKVKKQGNLLGTICNVNQGLRTGADKVTNKHIKSYNLSNLKRGEGIYILSEKELYKLCLNEFEKNKIKPLFKNSDISKYYCKKKEKFFLIDLFWPNNRDIDVHSIPNIMKHLKKFKPILENRKENANGIDKAIAKGIWWFASVRRRLNFEIPKIISPQRSKINTFGYNEIPWYASADVYFITEKNKSVLLKYILALLNSKLTYLWLYHRGKRKGETLELYQKPLSEIPIKKITESQQKPFIEIVGEILDITEDENYLEDNIKKTKVREYENQIDQMVYKLYDLTDDEIKIVGNFNSKK